MHDHATAVLDKPTEATSASMTGASARDQWIAKCTEDAARALATKNATLLPVLPADMLLPEPERCPDCHGTGYDYETFDLCCCMNGQLPAYDFARLAKGDVIATLEEPHRNPHEADVWVPCQHCDIAPAQLGPYDGGDLTRVPWAPDCPVCNDTGWMFSHYITAHRRMALPALITSASLAIPAPTSHMARSALLG